MEQINQQPQQNGTPTTNNNNQNPNQNPAPTPAPAANPQQGQPQQPKPTPPPVQPPKPITPPPAPKSIPSTTAQSKKNLIISGIIILVVLVLLLLVPHLKRSTPAPAPVNTNTDTELQDDQNTETNTQPKNPSATPSRAEALVSYAGKMITISGDCNVTPEDQTQPLGTTILINNDTDVRHTITIGPKSYTVSGKHYTLSWLNMAPGTFDITCDGEATDAAIDVE